MLGVTRDVEGYQRTSILATSAVVFKYILLLHPRGCRMSPTGRSCNMPLTTEHDTSTPGRAQRAWKYR